MIKAADHHENPRKDTDHPAQNLQRHKSTPKALIDEKQNLECYALKIITDSESGKVLS